MSGGMIRAARTSPSSTILIASSRLETHRLDHVEELLRVAEASTSSPQDVVFADSGTWFRKATRGSSGRGRARTRSARR